MYSKNNRNSRLCFVLFNIFVFSLFFSPGAIGSQPTINVEVVQPYKDGIEVGKHLKLQGTAIIPTGNYVWVLVHKMEGYKKVWWPQGEGEIHPMTKKWGIQIQLGEAEDINSMFEIAVITVDRDHHLKLEDSLMKSMESGKWLPIRMPQTTSPPKYRIVHKISH